jgi:electron transfer flavoprotein beta subunit
VGRLRPEVDPLDAHVRTDPRTAGCSAADAAALEWALRAGERWNQPVLAVTAGPPEADRVLREAVAAGATRAVRIDLPTSAPSAVVATAIAAVLGAARITSVWCGDHSLDRGSGSVPAFLAAELGAAQALGLVDVELDARAGRVDAWRRLDRGRREHVRLDGPGVVSVEGSTARLRLRFGAVMSSGRTTIEGHRARPAVREGNGATDRTCAVAALALGRACFPAPPATALDCPRAPTEKRHRQRSHGHEVVVLDPRRRRTDPRTPLRAGATGSGDGARPPGVARRRPVRPAARHPLGGCEQRGPHLPLDADTTIAVAPGRAAWPVAVATRAGGPPLADGASGEHAGFAGAPRLGWRARASSSSSCDRARTTSPASSSSTARRQRPLRRAGRSRRCG